MFVFMRISFLFSCAILLQFHFISSFQDLQRHIEPFTSQNITCVEIPTNENTTKAVRKFFDTFWKSGKVILEEARAKESKDIEVKKYHFQVYDGSAASIGAELITIDREINFPDVDLRFVNVSKVEKIEFKEDSKLKSRGKFTLFLEWPEARSSYLFTFHSHNPKEQVRTGSINMTFKNIVMELELYTEYTEDCPFRVFNVMLLCDKINCGRTAEVEVSFNNTQTPLSTDDEIYNRLKQIGEMYVSTALLFIQLDVAASFLSAVKEAGVGPDAQHKEDQSVNCISVE